MTEEAPPSGIVYRESQQGSLYSQPEGMLRAMGKWNKDTTDEELRERAEALGFPNFNSNGRQRIPDPLDTRTGGFGALPSEEEEDCEAFFSVGHEYTPDDMKTTAEKKGMYKAWFSDIAEDQHTLRIAEEKQFLVPGSKGKDEKLIRTPFKSTFKHPNRTIPVGVGPLYSIALEIVDVDTAEAMRQAMLQEEITQLSEYFKVRLSRATTKQQVRNVGGELNTRVKIEQDDYIRKALMDNVLPLILERLKDEEEEGAEDVEDSRGEPIHVPAEELPMHTITSAFIAPEKNPKGSVTEKVSFRVLSCPTPLPNASQKVTRKKCVWGPFFVDNRLLFCDKGTVPVARIHEVYLLLCYFMEGSLRVQVYSLEQRSGTAVYSYVIAKRGENESLRDCHFDYVARKIALAFNDYVTVIDCASKSKSNNASIISITSPLSAVYIGYGDLVVGTTRGGALSFRLDSPLGGGGGGGGARPPIYQSTPSTCPIRHIHRTGGNLYASNIMWTINLQTPDVNNYARGMEVSTTGSIFYQDRVVGIDSCGALLASLDKNGILQVQTNRLCLDPNDITKVLSSQVYSSPPKDTPPVNGLFISYQAVYLARKQLLCMYPTGQIQCVWLKSKE